MGLLNLDYHHSSEAVAKTDIPSGKIANVEPMTLNKQESHEMSSFV